MFTSSQRISVDLPGHLLEQLGENPADKILELLEKYVEQENVRVTEKPPRLPAR